MVTLHGFSFPRDWKYYTLTFPVARYKHLSVDGIIEKIDAIRIFCYYCSTLKPVHDKDGIIKW